MATGDELKKAYQELLEGDPWKEIIDQDFDELAVATENANIFDDLDFVVAEDLKAAIDLRTKLKNIWETAKKLKDDAKSIDYNLPEGSSLSLKEYHETVVAPSINSFLQTVKVTLENKFVDMSQADVEKYFPEVSSLPLLGAFWNLFQDTTPPANLSDILDDALGACLEYLSLHSGYSISLKKDVKETPGTSALGPAPIFSDLEKESLAPGDVDHYIGLVLNAKKSNGERSSPYIPLRTSPHHDKEPLKLGWEDQGYSLLDNGGDLVKRKNKSSDGVEVPLGTGIIVTEIVEGSTGTWVGIIFSDSRVSSGKINNWTSGGKRPLYTKIEYIRKKEDKIVSSPDPYTSRKLVAHELTEPFVNLPDGVRLISPDFNLNWTNLEPKDVRLAYFNFNKFNQKEMGSNLAYSASGLAVKPTTRYSEGYYYFIAGEGKRLTTKQVTESLLDPFSDEYPEPDPLTGNDNEEVKKEKQKASAQTTAQIKETAWDDLLRYLNKDMGEINSNLYKKLRDDYFIPVAAKVSTKTANPKNQKVLFTIPVSYIDALPDSIRPYNRDFDPESEFYNGKNFAFTLPVKEIRKRSKKLAEIFKKKIKPKIDEFKSSNGIIKNPYGLDYNIDIQIEAFEKFPDLLDRFFKRQAYPASSNDDNISAMCNDGVDTSSNHMMQIGLKDNNITGFDVRQTISYILFSPDPEKLKNASNSNLNLYEFDPYLTEDELSGKTTLRRSAIPLRIGLNWFREEFPGVLGSRTLHYLMAYKNIAVFETKGTRDFKSEDWIKFLQSYSTPPFEVHLSKNRTSSPAPINCKELIRQLRSSGPNSGLEEKKLQEQLYNNPECMEMYQKEWSDATPATDPESSKAALRKKQEDTQRATENSKSLQSFKKFYSSFLNNLDPQSLMALLMACLQHKVGIPITAEALCEAAIVHVVESIGIQNVKKTIIQNIPELAPYLGETSGYLGDEVTGIVENLEKNDATETEEVKDKLIDMDGRRLNPKFRNAPIAAAVALSGADPVVVNILLNLEKGGTTIELVPGPRPTGENTIVVPYGTGILPDAITPTVGGETYTISSPNYTWDEVDAEKSRLMSAGYSETEAKALLVQSNYLIPKYVQYEGLLSANAFDSTLDKLEGDLGNFGDIPLYGTTVSADGLRATVQDAKAWVQWLKTLVDIGALCEAIVGQLLEIPGLLFSDPGAFTQNWSNWGEDFWQGLKRRYSLPVPTMRFPFSLQTDSHMGDYSEKVLEAILSVAGMILGQILNLILRDALDKCYGEEDDIGPASAPALTSPAADVSIPLPSLPTIPGLEPSYILAWMKDLLGRLPPAQICDLLYGEPSRRLLGMCLEITKEDWQSVYDRGVDTRFEIQNIFFQIGKEINLDICDAIQATAPIITDACGATFDFDARCEELKLHGLTEEECAEQINRELDDLKNRVMAMTDLMFPGANPFHNAFPDPCAPGGGFVMPPGVQDTMSRITNNILNSVQGSLLQDLSSMKFLTLPPRAVQVASNPSQLKAAHAMFADAISDPYEFMCIAPVADSEQWTKAWVEKALPSYNLTYGKHMHAGLIINPPGQAEDAIIKILVGGLMIEGPYNMEYSELQSAHSSDNIELLRQVHKLSYLHYTPGENQFLAAGPHQEMYSTLQNHIGFKPVTIEHLAPYEDALSQILSIKEESQKTAKGTDIISELAKYIEVILKQKGLGVLQDFTVDGESFAPQAIANTFDGAGISVPELGKLIDKAFQREQKPMGLENLLYNASLLNNPNLEIINDWDGAAPPGIPGPLIGQSFIPNPQNPAQTPGYVKNKPSLREIIPLDTLVKEAFPAGGMRRYTQLMRAYTGINDPRTFGRLYDFNAAEYSGDEFQRAKSYWTYNPKTYDRLLELASKIGKEGASDALFWAFGEMTIGEATGLTNDRIKSLYPEFPSSMADQIEGVLFSEGYLAIEGFTYGDHAYNHGDQFFEAYVSIRTEYTTGLQLGIAAFTAYGSTTGNWGPIPMYVVFKKAFRDPNSILNSSSDSLLNYFSMEDTKVSPELYSALEAGPHVNAVESAFDPTNSNQFAFAASDLEQNTNFNPNILLYELPFTQFVSDNPAGQEAQEASAKMIELFGNLSTSDDQVQEITSQLSTVNKQSSIVLQHVITPYESHIFNQEEVPDNPAQSGPKDAFKLIKGKLTPLYPGNESVEPGPKGPPAIVTHDAQVDVTKSDHYEIDVSKKLDISVQQLLHDIFPEIYNVDPSKIVSSGASSSRLIEEYALMASSVGAPGSVAAGNTVKDAEKLMARIGADDKAALGSYVHNLVDPATGQFAFEPITTDLINYKVDSSPYILNPLNFKAMIFGKFMVQKLKTFYSQYGGSKSPNSSLWRHLQYILSSYGFSALQFGYSNQMFLKLKHSRLNYRKFLKKLWKKILRTPGAAIDPRCQEIFEQLGATSSKDLEETETDFFNLSEVKPKILNFYKKSICRSVHEQNPEDTPYKDLSSNAVRSTLIEGTVILLIKAYVLEMCVASVIAWDSFEISDVFKDDSMVQVIINNIKHDINAEDEDLLAFFANNIVRAQEKTTDVEGYLALSEYSALEYLIKKEGENAAKIIDTLFVNSNQLSTDLSLDILRTSDVDFPERYRKLRGLDNTSQIPHHMANLHTETGLDYVVNARFRQNIYSMNYGHGSRTKISQFDRSAKDTSRVSYLYGFDESGPQLPNVMNEAGEGQGKQLYGANQRAYFHSLPFNNPSASPMLQFLSSYRTGYYAHEAGDLSTVAGLPDGQDPQWLIWGSDVNKDVIDEWYNTEAASERYESFRNDIAGPQISGEWSYGNNPEFPAPIGSPPGDISEQMPSEHSEKPVAPHTMLWMELQDQLFGGADAWRNENTYEATHGNNMNAKFGNMTFQPFVKVVDATAEDNKNLGIETYSYTDQEGNPCDVPILISKQNINEILSYPLFYTYRKVANIFNAHIDGYVPLSVWSSFYTNVFLRYLEADPLVKKIFEKYGLSVFFKEIKIGIRLSYSTSFPVTEAGQFSWDLGDLSVEGSNTIEAFYKSIPNSALVSSKTFFNDRPYIITGIRNNLLAGPDAQAKGSVLRELMIPVKEVSQNLNLLPNGFDIGGETIPYEQLGYYPSKFIEPFQGAATAVLSKESEFSEIFNNLEEAKFALNTWHQFFYKNLAQDLVDDLKESAEFKLLFDYLFPMRRYMALAMLYGAEGLSKFVSKPTNVLEETKDTILETLKGIIKSGDYTFVPDNVANALVNFTSEAGTRPNDPDLAKQIIEIILKTPLLILKGFVEVTDPAIIIAKAIIDIANMIQQAVIGAVKQALQTVKATLQTAISQAEAALAQVEAAISVAATTGEAIVAPIPENMRPKINKNNGIDTWTVEIPSLTEGEQDALESAGLTAVYQQSKEKFEEVEKLLSDYKTVKNKIGIPGGDCNPGDGPNQLDPPGTGLKGEKKSVECDLEKVVKESEELMKDLFSSPFLLPGVWAALLPSQVPYGGGIIPFPAGPPSTIPGMIYLAILFIDGFEEKMHDQVTKTKDASCEDEL